MSNSIFSIITYRHGAGWAFTDEKRDLLHEPFVSGADTLIERISDGADEVHIIFSAVEYPDHDLALRKETGEVGTGTWYVCEQLGHRLWLCPALGKYFDKSPEMIYVSFTPLFQVK